MSRDIGWQITRSSDAGGAGPTIRRMRGKVIDIRRQAEHWWHRP